MATRQAQWFTAGILVPPVAGAVASGALAAYLAAAELDPVERQAVGALPYRAAEHLGLATAAAATAAVLGISLGLLLDRVVRPRLRGPGTPILATACREQVIPAAGALLLLGVAAVLGPSFAAIPVLGYALLAVVHACVAGLDRAAPPSPPPPHTAGRYRGASGALWTRLRTALPAVVCGIRTAFVLGIAAVLVDGALGGVLPGAGGLGAVVDAGISQHSAPMVVMAVVGSVMLALAVGWLILVAERLSGRRKAGGPWGTYPDLTEDQWPADAPETLSSAGRR